MNQGPTPFIQQITNRTLQITFNKPKQANSFTLSMYTDLQHIIQGAANDDNVDVVLIKANGRNFTSGNDLNNFNHYSDATGNQQALYAKEMANLVKQFAEAFLAFPKPLIAACQGGVIGFFFPLLSVFDQVYITEDTYFFAPMLLFAQGVEMFSSYTFPRLFGHGKAFSLLVKCEKLSAAEAMQFGFAQKCLKNQEELHKYAIEACNGLVAMKSSSLNRAKSFLVNPIREQLYQANLKETQCLEKIWSSKELLLDVSNYMMKLKSKL